MIFLRCFQKILACDLYRLAPFISHQPSKKIECRFHHLPTMVLRLNESIAVIFSQSDRPNRRQFYRLSGPQRRFAYHTCHQRHEWIVLSALCFNFCIDKISRIHAYAPAASYPLRVIHRPSKTWVISPIKQFPVKTLLYQRFYLHDIRWSDEFDPVFIPGIKPDFFQALGNKRPTVMIHAQHTQVVLCRRNSGCMPQSCPD